MDIPRQFVRYAMTGGYALMITVYYEAVYGWAWRRPVEEVVPTDQIDAFTTIGGAVAVGFVLYQLYASFDRPNVRLLLALPRWTPAWLRGLAGTHTIQLRLLSVGDVSSIVIGELRKLPAARRALRRAYGRTDEPGGACILSSLLNLTHASGDGQIARNYAALEDLYHTLGACRVALVAISAAAAVDIAAKHSTALRAHSGRSAAVTVLSLLLIWGSCHVIEVNRRSRWFAMAEQLRCDLRAWALRHPELLNQLADGQRQR